MTQLHGIPMDKAGLLSITLEAILYGFSVLMFILTMWSSLHRHKNSDGSPYMMIVAWALLILSTAHMVIDLLRLEEAFVEYRDTFPGGPIAFFSDIKLWGVVSKNVLYTLQTMLGDGVVIYRCYVVWQSWRIAVFPILLWISVATTGFGLIIAQTTGTEAYALTKSTGAWIPAFFASSMATNLLSTSLLAYRIWMIDRNSAKYRLESSLLWPVVRIVLDAGLLYTSALLPALVSFLANDRGMYVLLDMIMPIISITFYMVIIRITLASPRSVGGMQSTTRTSRSSQGPQLFSLAPIQFHATQPTTTGASIDLTLHNHSAKDISLPKVERDEVV
ncbi:hypothetical protein SERLA73DRAFT_182539 [Serpula lacrymans var. lacrymans S7.3]|uniref:Uncharacterized protein n=2 Tax=Serpula lacrymans var. lacrymans TaxID=341189 RepID=F8Q0G2_SERL3|nr:uncharacterized protein SERLADRAFT_469242 [Serpula lacrymans var. lacrymans S7.9]EGN97791.1 hypothetical protein SERLA73DRAFT_182539 [Serpula lacrymans var. lacrymans S7.3]EGO23383.1 hypothetical protein SERLADRAFT_469242 [Serpula lacrymans var. lacrymans S7.9]